MKTDPQNYNRYSYVRNNPLRYTDPSGEYYENSPWYYDTKTHDYFYSSNMALGLHPRYEFKGLSFDEYDALISAGVNVMGF